MTFALELSAEQQAALQERAKELGIAPKDLARAAVMDLLTRPSDEFRKVAARVLAKNHELYERLS